ncbi:SDR family oxidoreductase [Nocardia sp. R6R-6]|uniref:SDR family oxidoreductase n=1 Tax=Nocardia sp. R6R-6 TaxID=3459303 RepID=UPI00403D8B94
MSHPRTVLITGGSSGIGAEIARQFLASGDRVTVFDRHEAPFAGVETVIGDVRRAEDNMKAVAAASLDGKLDVLIANAGIHDGGRTLRDAAPSEVAQTVQRLFEVNVLGYVLALTAAGPALERAGGAAVLTLSDASFDVRGNGAGVGYIIAKHAALGLCRAAARDLAPEVRVNAVAPGGVATALSSESDSGVEPVVTDPALLAERLAGRTLLQRGANLQQIASAYVYLASSAAAGITGQVLRVDGGLIS